MITGGDRMEIIQKITLSQLMELASMVDHTNLDPNATTKDIEILAQQAIDCHFGAVCVRPDKVEVAANYLNGQNAYKNVKIASVVGFPVNKTETVEQMIAEQARYTNRDKVKEVKYALSKGASEIDMIIDLKAIKSGEFEKARNDVRAVVDVAGRKHPVKVIIETGYLTYGEKDYACDVAESGGAAFVKTATGFGIGGATIDDVNLMCISLENPEVGIKASGKVHKFEFGLQLYQASQSNGPRPFRIGASKLAAEYVRLYAELTNPGSGVQASAAKANGEGY
jgi:deoxyribose-phosphate aldolase